VRSVLGVFLQLLGFVDFHGDSILAF